ncbi:DUF2637 domain-containing protein [Haloechinothrix salitolerans]|uniref:DUF2637 domain-containing protein n=1 Tax=Haloechinothrix salitolerans TaxID=926830 RepID=A0ABW2BZ07_9PSEU
MTTKPGAPRPRPDRLLRLQCVCTMLVALGAAYVSYQHGRAFALRFGADDTTATLWPLIVDGLLIMATIELWKTGRRQVTSGQWKAWLSFTLGIALSLCANIASAPDLNPFAIAVAACPPLALLLSVELLNEAIKRHSAQDDGDEADAPESLIPETSNGEKNRPCAQHPAPADGPPDPRTPPHNIAGRTRNNGRRGPVIRHNANDPLHEQAVRLDAEHWHLYQRPISADTLRRHLRIGSRRARTLTRRIRQQHPPRTTST